MEELWRPLRGDRTHDLSADEFKRYLEAGQIKPSKKDSRLGFLRPGWQAMLEHKSGRLQFFRKVQSGWPRLVDRALIYG